MSLADNNTGNLTVAQPSPIPVLLYVFSILMALSILCYMFVSYYFFTIPMIHRALNNHVIILMLIVYAIQTVFDTPLHLEYFRRGFYWPPSLSYCFLLFMLDYVTYEIGLLLMVWASIERHILVFNASLFNTRTRRILGHYCPLAFCFIYPVIYYTYFILFYPCESYYDLLSLTCIAACYLSASNTMAIYEFIANGFVPVCLIALFSTALLVRIVWKRQQMGRQMTWKKNRKMTVQLLGISTAFLVFNIGYFVIALVQLVDDPSFGANLLIWFLSLNVCAPQLVFPFLCLSTLPDLKRKLTVLIPWYRHAAVEPHPLTMARTAHHTTNNAQKSLRDQRMNTLT